MILRPWTKLPNKMRTKEVYKYYVILEKRKTWLVFERLIDVVISFIMLVVLIIPMAFIAVAIKLDSRGPVLFL